VFFCILSTVYLKYSIIKENVTGIFMDKYFRIGTLPGAFVLTLILSALSLILALFCPAPDRWLCLAAMLASSVGDIFLMDFRGLSRKLSNYFVLGAICFMFAHILYICSFAQLLRFGGYPLFNPGFATALLLGIVLLIYFLKTMTDRSSLPLALIYLAIIIANCSVIFSCAWATVSTHPLSILAPLGALSFLLSDAIIGLGLLSGNHRFDHLIWWFYPVGQLLLILAA